MISKTYTTLILGAFILSSCTWVKLTEDGQAVRIVSEVAQNCELKGRTTAVSRANVAGINRNEEKFQIELETIARNQAATLQGNVVIADGPIDGNQRAFRIYQCL